jgi:hypothetical protein
MTMNRLALCLLAAATAALAGTNIHPDPSFETTGVPGTARTGQRAGHLKVGQRVHWKAIGGKLSVEPFATYRATAWVKATPGTGSLMGLYCYSWNAFDWAWTRPVRLGPTSEWKRIETTIVSPNDHVFFHPLAASGAANAEAWVDDVAIEKVKSPAETIEAILANPPGGRDGVALHVRALLAKGQIDEAKKVVASANDYAKADLAFLLAQQAETRAERLRLAVDVIRYGGLGYGRGPEGVPELYADATPEERRTLFAAALEASKFSAAAARSYAQFLIGQVDEAMAGASLTEAETRLDALAAELAAVGQRAPANAPGRKELAMAKQRIAAARGKLAERRAQLGTCVIKVGGKALTPKTHAIVVPEEPTPQEDFAAGDLQAHIELLTGGALPIVKEGQLGERTPIAVGKCRTLHKRLGVSVDFDGLGAEGIRILTKGPALILGGNQRGVLYAVYTFLEDSCGCRWFTPDCTRTPRTGTFDIPRLDVRHVPPLEYRSTDYPKSRDATWAVRNKINGTQTRLDEKRGGKIAYSHFVHTFNSILNPADHFAEHPEWFSMVDGKRIGGRTQLCLTNPEVLDIAKKTVRQWIEQRPDATIFSVSQNDWRNPCECPKCKAIDEREGSHAGTLIRFVNAIARDIAADYPDKLISTLAYQYTRTPPKHVEPEPNVTVRLCTIECDFAHPLDESTHPQNVKFVEDITGWNRICNRLYIWDYIIDYGHSVMPWPNLHVLKPNIRFFINHGVKGLYEEACYFTRGSEWAELRTWIIAKTMWDPDYDTDQAIDEFLAGYYGPAAPHLRKYIDLIHQPVLDDPKMYIHIWTPPTAPYLTKQTIAESVRLFDQAEKAVADDPTLLHRVQVARLPIMYVQITTAKGGYREKGDVLVTTMAADVEERVARFERLARKEGLTTIRENRRTGALDRWLKSIHIQGATLPILRLENERLELAILPTLGGRIWRMVHKPTGRDILKRYRRPDGTELPSLSGYEEYAQGEYHSPGWNEPYKVVRKAANFVTLQTHLEGGLRLTRTITLDPKQAVVHVDSKLANTAQEPGKAQLRTHPGFAVSDVAKCELIVARPGGKTERRSLAFEKDPKQEKDQWLRGAALPAGHWAIADTGTGLVIHNRFQPDQVEQCLLNRSGADARVNLELYARPVTLAPGERQRLQHRIEVEAR